MTALTPRGQNSSPPWLAFSLSATCDPVRSSASEEQSAKALRSSPRSTPFFRILRLNILDRGMIATITSTTAFSGQPGDPAARTDLPFAKGPADRG